MNLSDTTSFKVRMPHTASLIPSVAYTRFYELTWADMSDPSNTRILFGFTAFDTNNKRVASWANGDPLELIKSMHRDIDRMRRGDPPEENCERTEVDLSKLIKETGMREIELYS